MGRCGRPGRVVHDTRDELAWILLPGSEVLGETTYVEARHSGAKPPSDRLAFVPASGDWTRTAIGFDTRDLTLDLVIEPDLTRRWEDAETAGIVGAWV